LMLWKTSSARLRAVVLVELLQRTLVAFCCEL
jgi:hypothetical protein